MAVVAPLIVMVMLYYPQPNVDPQVIAYKDQPQEFVVDKLPNLTFTDSIVCQKTAAKISSMRGKVLHPGIKGRVAGAWCKRETASTK